MPSQGRGDAGRKRRVVADTNVVLGASRPPSRVGKRSVNFYLEPSLWEALKVESAYLGGRPIQSIMEELVASFVAARHKERTAGKR